MLERLLQGLSRAAAPALSLVESLAALRRGPVLRSGEKVLLVLDQFEQWLFARRGEENTELVAALRQCDGEHVQAIVLVRDDFWMAGDPVHARARDRPRSMARTSPRVDLFDLAARPEGARGVRARLRRACRSGRPDSPKDQRRSSSRRRRAGPGRQGHLRAAGAVRRDGQGEALDPSTLSEVGGTEGVGVTFLEETFASPPRTPSTASTRRRRRPCSKALLPGRGTDIKGQMRSERGAARCLGLRATDPVISTS